MVSSPTPQVTLVSASHSGLGPRFCAYLFDLVVCFLVLVAVAITLRVLRTFGVWTPAVAGGADPVELWRSLGFGAKLSVVVAFMLTQGWLYFVLFEASAWQATVGKRLLSLYVTDDVGQPISIARSCGRSLAKWFFACFGGSFVSAISIALTDNRKALHDYAASTQVLRGRPTNAGALELWRVAAAFVIPFAWSLGTFLLTL
jgi:uncharacterized RDD family membrane protein YckC